MRIEILVLALIVGAANYGFRYLPTRADLSALHPKGWLSRFLAATGPAAIATLFVASVLPLMAADWRTMTPAAGGVLAVLGAFWGSRSVVVATLAGAVAHGLCAALV